MNIMYCLYMYMEHDLSHVDKGRPLQYYAPIIILMNDELAHILPYFVHGITFLSFFFFLLNDSLHKKL